MISVHSLAVTSYEIDPMLEEKYQTLKQNICNNIVTSEVMLEPVTSPISSTSDKLEDEEKIPYVEEIPIKDPTEREFRERLRNMEQDEEVPSYIKSEVIRKREIYYLTLKR